MSRGRDIGTLFAWTLVCQVTGAIGAVFTSASVTTWCARIQKPAWTPPSWIFGPVWITLYTLMAIAAWMIWRTGKTRPLEHNDAAAARRRRIALGAFGVQLLLNGLWSPLFFGLRSPLLGLIDISLLILALAATITLFASVSRTAAGLLAPYLAWILFAGALNLRIWRLNV